jgi:CrcB protein
MTRANGPSHDSAEGRNVIDPDYDRHDRAQAQTGSYDLDILAAIAAGGVLGAEGRYGLSLLMPHEVGQFAWSTVVVNVSGCLLIGVLMVVLLELTSPHRLARPFLGVGILGGYTTFSTFAMDADQLLLSHRAPQALLYVVVTAVLCAVAVWAATVLARGVGRVVELRRQKESVR